jgi:hypothetical protein
LRTGAAGGVAVDTLRGQKVLAVCGIGNPGPFLAMVRAACTACQVLTFADHHAYTGNDLSAIAACARQGPLDAIVTTEKDWVKWSALPQGPALLAGAPPVYRPILAMTLLDGSEALTQLLRSVVRSEAHEGIR